MNDSSNSSNNNTKGSKSNTSVVTDYTQLHLNPHLISALQQEFQFDNLTGIQARCIPAALQGRDLLA